MNLLDLSKLGASDPESMKNAHILAKTDAHKVSKNVYFMASTVYTHTSKFLTSFNESETRNSCMQDTDVVR